MGLKPVNVPLNQSNECDDFPWHAMEVSLHGTSFPEAPQREEYDRQRNLQGKHLEHATRIDTLWWTNIAMENHHF